MNRITVLISFWFTLVGCASQESTENKVVLPEKDLTEVSEIPSQQVDSIKMSTVVSVPLPTHLSFAGEDVPLDRQDIKERLELELISNSYRHSRTLLILKNLHRWKPVIDSLLKEEKIPTDFIYMAVAESEFNVDIRSHAGAMGMWQFMKRTGKDYKLIQNKYIDQRKDPFLATKAACSYIRDAYGRFQNWTLTAASYNMGQAGLKKKMKEQKVDSYYDLYLYRETARYVFRILAFKIIAEHPEKYGFHIPEEELYQPWQYKEVLITKSIDNLVDFCKARGITYNDLRYLNPSLHNTRSYELKLESKQKIILRLPIFAKKPVKQSKSKFKEEIPSKKVKKNEVLKEVKKVEEVKSTP